MRAIRSNTKTPVPSRKSPALRNEKNGLGYEILTKLEYSQHTFLSLRSEDLSGRKNAEIP